MGKYTLDKQRIFDFLTQLSRNNRKEWMDENRGEYQTIKAIFIEVIDEIIRQVKLIDPEFPPITAKKALLRINRNLMYSQDKTPYKNYMGASIIKEEGKADFYIHISPEECFIAGGFYHPSNEILKSIRQEIDYERDKFLSIINASDFQSHFGKLMQEDRLKTAPREYSVDHQMIEYLRLKSLVVSHPVEQEEFLAEDFVQNTVKLYETLLPFRKFLDQSLVEYREEVRA